VSLRMEGPELLAEVSDDRAGFWPDVEPRVGLAACARGQRSSAGRSSSRAIRCGARACG
jgi:hypothetical protein